MSFYTLLDVLAPRPRAAPRRPATRRSRLDPLDDRALPSDHVQADLVSDQAGVALARDPELVDAWGIALNSAPTGAFWLSAHGSGLSTLDSGDVTRPDGTRRPLTKGALTVTVPGGPTGQVFNAPAAAPPDEDFFVSAVEGGGNVDPAGDPGRGAGGDEPASAGGSLVGDASTGDMAEVADDGADVSALDVFGGASVLEDDPLELG